MSRAPSLRRIILTSECGILQRRGASADIPHHSRGLPSPVDDWHGLRRWRSANHNHQPAAAFSSNQPTFWEHYKWLIIIVLALCLLEAALIDILLRERRRRRLAQQRLEERLRFEQLVSELSSTFINLPPEKVEAQIIEALGQVASLLRFDIAALSVFTGRGTEGRVAYIWRAEECRRFPRISPIRIFPGQPKNCSPVVTFVCQAWRCCRRQRASIAPRIEKYHVRSSYSVPMVAGGKVIGVLGLNTVGEEREISSGVVAGAAFARGNLRQRFGAQGRRGIAPRERAEFSWPG